MKNYRFLLFDADNTLFDFDRSERVAFEAALAAFGKSCGEREYAIYHEINDRLWKLFERGGITKASLSTERFRLTFAELGLDITPAGFAERYVEELSLCSFTVDGAVGLCRSLCTGFELYLVTNGIERVQRSRFARSELRPFFRDIFISEALGAQKPSKEYFDRTAALIPGFDRAAALVIGDSLTSDIAGARNAGIDCCWFNPRGDALTGQAKPEYTIARLRELNTILNAQGGNLNG